VAREQGRWWRASEEVGGARARRLVARERGRRWRASEEVGGARARSLFLPVPLAQEKEVGGALARSSRPFRSRK
jgi:hypothetical protein